MAIDSFNLSSLPTRLRAYIEEIIDTTDADPVMVVMSLLCMSSAFVKKSCFIPESNNNQESEGYFQKLYPNIWALCISPSGSFKTTALSKGFKLAYENDSSFLHATRDKNDSSVSKRVLLSNRTTTEALIEELAEGHGGALVCSEFGAWLQSMERTYNQGLKQLLTEFYDVRLIYTYRTKAAGETVICEPFISICGVSTIEWVKDNITKDDISSGFFARFLIFFPPQTNKMPPALPAVKKTVFQGIEDDVKKILTNLPDKRSYKINEPAKEAFTKFHESLYNNTEQYSESSQSFLKPFLKRWSPYVLKIAMLMQLFIDEKAEVISLEAMNSAIEIIDYCFRSTAELFEQELGESEHQKKIRKVTAVQDNAET